MAGGYRGSSLHNKGERGEDLTDFTRMFESIIIAFSVAVVAYHIGQAERAQYVTHAARFCRPCGRSRWGDVKMVASEFGGKAEEPSVITRLRKALSPRTKRPPVLFVSYHWSCHLPSMSIPIFFHESSA